MEKEMNLKKLLSKLSIILVLLTVFAANASAQTYVSNTNGNDITGNGNDVGIGLPYKTITVGIAKTADGGTIIIDADTYNSEPAGPVDLTGGGTGKNLTFVARTFNGLQVVTITNGIAVGTAKTVNLGLTGVQFQTANVNLTLGTLNITSGNLVITSGGTITRTAGTINATPTTTNVNVTYNGAVAISSGSELPATLGTGTLSALLTAANTVSITSALTVNNIVVNAASTLSFTQNATLTNNINNSGVIQLNSTTLTWAPPAPPAPSVTVIKLGTIVSATAGTIGAGTISLSGSNTITLDSGAAGTVPNLTVPAGYTGQLTLNNTLTVDGTFTLASATSAVFALNGQQMNVRGNFIRTDNTPGNFTTGTGDLNFLGAAAQSFNPGASLVLYSLDVNKNAGTAVTLGASVSVVHNLTVTSGNLDVGNFNLNMITNSNVVTNNGLAYSSTLLGYIVFQGVGGTVQGTGTFGNILVNLPIADIVTTSGNVNFSGILFINQGTFDVATGTTMTFNNTLVANPTIKMNAGTTSNFTLLGTGAVSYSAFVNLDYFGAGNHDASAATNNEWNASGAITKINNLTIEVASGNFVIGAAGPSTINGTLTVKSGAILVGSGTYTLAGAGLSHVIAGTVSGGTLLETGSGSSITGSSVTADAASIVNLTINVGSAGTFTSTLLKSMANLTNTTGTSTITMNPTVAATPAITGNLLLTAGNVTLGIVGTAAQEVIAGTSTLTAGTLTLGSNITVAGQTTQGGGNLALGSFNYTQLGSAATPDYNRTGAGTVTGTGNLIFDATAAIFDFQPGTTFTVPNLTMIAAGFGISMDGPLTVSNSLTHTSGNVNYTNITLSGPTYIYNAGTSATTIGGTFTVTNIASTLTFNGSTTIPTFVVNAPGGTVTIASSSATAARTITASTAFTLTAGTLALGNNTLAITGTGAVGFVNVAGAITELPATSTLPYGNLVFDNAGLNFVTGTGFSIDNLEIQANATNLADNKVYTVNKNLLLTANTLTNIEKLTIGNGALVTVNAGSITPTTSGDYPLYGGVYDVTYIGTAGYTAGYEIPASTTVLRNLTVADATTIPPAVSPLVVSLANATVNGTFYEKLGNFTILSGKTVTLVSGGTWDIGLGSLTLAGAPAGVFARTTYNLIYSDGFNNTTNLSTEFPVSGTNILSLQVLGAGTKVKLDNSKTVNGPITINGDATTLINFRGSTLSATGNVTVTAGEFTNGPAGTTGSLAFTGTLAQTFTIPAAGLTFPDVSGNSGAVLEINNAAGVLLTGGNLTMLDPKMALTAGFAPADFQTSILKLTAGIFTTGLNTIVLWQSNATGSPVQGYTRITGWVNGNVKKYLDATNAYYTGTTGGVASQALTRVEFPVGSATNYRPMAYQFNTLPTANFNLTVTEVDNNPGGTNGFPITSGSIQLANYPPFYWLVTSDLTLQPQVTYDIEAEANGYGPSNYTEGIQNVRFLRRFAPVATISNPWVLQGSASGNAIYDNSTVGTGFTAHAKVIVRSAEGAISTQGALFTFSQAAKSPSITAVGTPAITANAVTVATGSLLTIKFTAASLNLSGTATFNATPVWSATAPAVVPTNTLFTVGTPASTGTLTWTPTYTQTGVYKVLVSAVDGTLSATDTVTITVTPGAPSFTVAPATASASVAKALTLTYTAVFATGDVITYSVAANKAVSAAPTITAAGAFSWTPAVSDIALSPVTFTVTAKSTNTNLTATTTTLVTVGYGVAVGDVNGDLSITAADAALILQEVVGLVTFTPTQMFAADVNGDGKVGALDAAWILYYAVNGTFPPTAKSAELAGTVGFGKFAADNEVMELPITLQNTSGVKSFYAEVTLGTNVVFKSVKTSLPDGWQIASNVDNGVLKIAMAGISSLTEGNVAVIEVSLKNKESVVNVQGSIKMNDALTATMQPVQLREIPTNFSLSQNYPNPFNPTTNINYSIAQDANVKLMVYNSLGQVVKTIVNSQQKAGYYTIRWDGSNDMGSKVSSGMYIYRITAGNFTHSVKMNLIK
jgi:hypothetical protein